MKPKLNKWNRHNESMHTKRYEMLKNADMQQCQRLQSVRNELMYIKHGWDIHE